MRGNTNKPYCFFNNLKFRTKLIISFVLLITIPMSIIGVKYYDTSKAVISDLTRKNVYEIVKKNNEIIDARLSKVVDNTLRIIIDKDFFNIFKNTNESEISFMQMDRDITKVLGQYFPQENNVYSSHIITSYGSFGDKTASYVPHKSFAKSGLYSEATDAGGNLVWVPTYDFSEMYQQENLEDIDLNYKYLFSAVRLVNVSFIDNGVLEVLDSDIERPVLLVNFKEDIYKSIFEESIPINGSSYMVLSPDGHIISHSDTSKLAKIENYPWLNEMIGEKSGSTIISIGGSEMIACFDTSSITGWISVVVIPPENLMGSMMVTIRTYTIYLSILLIGISLIIGYLFSIHISKPIKKLQDAFRKTSKGDFGFKVPLDGHSEFDTLLSNFNTMNNKIQLLIKENYEVKLKEKEAEIAALNLQFNPHFLYNTLNTINWMAIENKQKDISSMLISLSTMLQYTVKGEHEMSCFRQDMEWMESYLHIMSIRFEDKFIIEYDIDEQINDCLVPKLFLQPFIENIFVHGLDEIKAVGIIRISGRVEGNTCVFCVEDNGKGIDEEKIFEILNFPTDSIGINNVNKRIKLLFGDEYGVNIESKINKGTRVLITIPQKLAHQCQKDIS